jgi:hypothetical protein
MEALYLVGLILALVDELLEHGRNILGWAVVAVCIGLLWTHLSHL